jgi:hypothetical protein
MAPKQKVIDVEDEIGRLQARTLKLQYKAVMEEVTTRLKANPELLTSTLQHIKNIHGVSRHGGTPSKKPEDQGKETPMKASEESDEAKETPQKKPKLTSPPPTTPSAHSDDASTVSISRADIPRCYTKVGSLPPHFLAHVINEVEPISLSKNAMRALCTRGQKAPSKTNLLELFEFLTSMGPDDDFLPVLHKIPVLVRSCVAFNERRGKPARDLRLPALWAHNGVYSIIIEEKEGQSEILVKHRILNITKPVPAVFDSCGQQNEIYVEKNFSEHRALLVNPGNCAKWPLQNMFPEIMECQFKVVNLEADMGEGGLAIKDEGQESDGTGGAAELHPEIAPPVVSQFPCKEEKVEEEESQLPSPPGL